MSLAEMDRFVREYSTNADLREGVAASGDLAAAAAFAQSKGYDVHPEEAKTYLEGMRNDTQAELSEAQLDAVAGGKGPNMAALVNNNVSTEISQVLGNGDSWKQTFG